MEDSTDHEYHLTPNGWVAGTYYWFHTPQKIVERPDDCVETWNRKMRQSSGFSSEFVTWKRIWTSPDYSESERQALRDKHPLPRF